MGLELYILLLGLVMVLVLLLRPALERIGVPPLVGYFVLGVLLRLADVRWQLLGPAGIEFFEVLGYVGVIVLPFCAEPWAVPAAVFANRVVVAAATTGLAPLGGRPLLDRSILTTRTSL
jgi:Kef-type K+ transport system membrane component KefB